MPERLLSAPLLLAATAIALGSGVDAIVKGFAPQTGLWHLIAWRFLFGGLISLAVYRAGRRPFPSVEAIRFHSFRGAVQLVAAYLFFYGLTKLPLAEATIIGFTAALMVPFVAWLILKETLAPIAIGATIIGFIGAAIAVSHTPEIDVSPDQRKLGLIAAFIAAFLYALMLVLLRMRATKEDAVTIAMFTNVVPAVFAFPAVLILLGFPRWTDLPLFLLLGCIGYSVWYIFTLAYARAPAQRLAPLEYTALIWSGLFGVLFFQEVPGLRLYLGAALIILACLVVAFEGRFMTRKEANLPVSDLPE